MAATSSSLRLKILIGIAALVGVYIYATSGSDEAGDKVVGTARERSTSAGAGANASGARASGGAEGEDSLLGSRPARNVSSTAARMTTADAGALLARLTHRVAKHSEDGLLFGRQSWYVAPPPPPPVPVVYTPPPPPTAPPLPFGAMGSYSRPGDPTVYFLTRGERVFDVRVGDTIDNLYKVDGEANGQLLLTYIPLKIQQSLALGATQ